jgi:histidine ammonia-lyase
VLTIDMNASAENPLFTDSGSWHHGGFHHVGLALALDQLRLALVQAASLSLARLTKINDPAITGLRQFLADGPDGSSGTMVLEYAAASALADLRQWAQPASLGQTVLSLGVEDHASFAWQAAIATRSSMSALRTILSCELVAAVRATRLREAPPRGHPLEELLTRSDSLPDIAHDHVLVDDLRAADSVLDTLR